MIKKPIIRTLDLFAGAGGFSLGLHWAGFTTVAAIDHNHKAIETLKVNFGGNGTVILQRDLAEFKPRELEQYLKKNGLAPSFDVIIGGPPCQGWSKVGRGKIRSLLKQVNATEIEDPRNKLYLVFLDYIRHFKPKVCIMENVPGMLSHNGNNVAEIITANISDLGYQVTCSLVNASDYGVPQNRPRLIFVGFRNNLNRCFEFPPVVTRRNKRVYPLVTLRDSIGDLPLIRNGARRWVRPYRTPNKKTIYLKKMRRGADPDKIYDHVCRDQNDQDLQAFKLLKQGGIYKELPKHLKRYREDIFNDKYKKLIWDKPSNCITAHLGKDCYTHIHPAQTRTISVREAARIQSFPDHFYFAGSMGDKFTLVGNAVPPLLAEKLGKEIKRQVSF